MQIIINPWHIWSFFKNIICLILPGFPLSLNNTDPLLKFIVILFYILKKSGSKILNIPVRKLVSPFAPIVTVFFKTNVSKRCQIPILYKTVSGRVLKTHVAQLLISLLSMYSSCISEEGAFHKNG
jgi:hypothetical protein